MSNLYTFGLGAALATLLILSAGPRFFGEICAGPEVRSLENRGRPGLCGQG